MPYDLVGRLGAKQADAARSIRTIVRDAGFSEQRFDDWRAQQLGDIFQLAACPERALSSKDGDSLALIQNLRCLLEVRSCRQLDALRPYFRYVLRLVSG